MTTTYRPYIIIWSKSLPGIIASRNHLTDLTTVTVISTVSKALSKKGQNNHINIVVNCTNRGHATHRFQNDLIFKDCRLRPVRESFAQKENPIMRNKLLLRQVKKYLKNTESLPNEFQPFLEAVSNSYDHFEENHSLMIHSLSLCSKEMNAMTDQLQKEAAENLEMHNRLKRIINNISEGIYSLNVETMQYEYVSVTCKLILGFNDDDDLSDWKRWFNLIHTDDKASVLEQFRQNKKGKPVTYQYRIVTGTGSVKWLESKVIPVVDDRYKLVSIDGVLRDITAQKQAEFKLRTINDSLEFKVQERTTQLVEINKDLEAMNYMVSHDLRTPLRGIELFSELIQQKIKDNKLDDVYDYLTQISKCTAEMNELINYLLHFTKTGMELGQWQLQMENFCLNVVIKDICNSFKQLNPEKEIQFEIAKLPELYADKHLIKQVFTNLISNAVKYSSKRSVIKIKVGGQITNAGISYTVQDNGIGFDSKDAQKLFQPFTRLHNDPAYIGTGAGLTITQRIVKLHNGHIKATGKPNNGAIFTVNLPHKEKSVVPIHPTFN